MPEFDKLQVPEGGEPIALKNDRLEVPNNPILPFIRGDGVGPDIWNASVKVFDAAVAKAYGRKRKVIWMEIFAGERAKQKYGELLPRDTYQAIKTFRVAIKGPLTTPVGGGFRSLNVTLRQELNHSTASLHQGRGIE